MGQRRECGLERKTKVWGDREKPRGAKRQSDEKQRYWKDWGAVGKRKRFGEALVRRFVRREGASWRIQRGWGWSERRQRGLREVVG